MLSLPERLKRAIERSNDRIGQFLKRMMPHKKVHSGPEQMTADVLPAFMQFGGPLLDRHESDRELLVTIEVPGLKRDDVSVELVGRRLTIRGEKQITHKRKGGDGDRFYEKRYGSFTRTLQLPYDVDDSTVKADLAHGVLTIRLSRPESERDRRFRVPVS